MDTFYEVLDNDSGMLLKEFDRLDQALTDLRVKLLQHDPNALLDLALLKVENDRSSLIAMSEDLLQLVRRSASVVTQAAKTRAQTTALKPMYNYPIESTSWQGSTSTTQREIWRAA